MRRTTGSVIDSCIDINLNGIKRVCQASSDHCVVGGDSASPSFQFSTLFTGCLHLIEATLVSRRLATIRCATAQKAWPLVLAVCNACGLSAGTTVAQSALEPATGWAPPTRLAALPPNRNFSWPSLAISRDTLYVAANLMPTLPQLSIGLRQLFLMRVPGGVLSLPEGPFAFAYPQAVVDREGAYHLFWTEFQPRTTPPTRWPASPSALWHSTLVRGTWTRPEKLLEGAALFWNRRQGNVVVDSRGIVHVVVAGNFSTGGFAVGHMSLRGGTWQLQQFPGVVLYTSLTATRDHLVLAYVAADQSSSATRLVVARAPLVTGEWGPTVGVTSFGNGHPLQPFVLVERDSALNLIWFESAAPLSTTAGLHHASSVDGGASWSEGRSVEVHAIPDAVTAAPSRCGPTIIVESIDSARIGLVASLREVRLSAARASAPRAMYPQFPSTVSGAIASLGDSLKLVFSAIRDSSAAPDIEVGSRAACPPRP